MSVCLWIILSFNITSCAFVYYQVLLYIGVVATLAVARSPEPNPVAGGTALTHMTRECKDT